MSMISMSSFSILTAGSMGGMLCWIWKRNRIRSVIRYAICNSNKTCSSRTPLASSSSNSRFNKIFRRQIAPKGPLFGAQRIGSLRRI